jgi:transposase
MAETRRKFDRDFREGAVRLVRETGKPIAEVARDLGINPGTLGNWVNADKRRRGDGSGALDEDERAEPANRFGSWKMPGTVQPRTSILGMAGP